MGSKTMEWVGEDADLVLSALNAAALAHTARADTAEEVCGPTRQSQALRLEAERFNEARERLEEELFGECRAATG